MTLSDLFGWYFNNQTHGAKGEKTLETERVLPESKQEFAFAGVSGKTLIHVPGGSARFVSRLRVRLRPCFAAGKRVGGEPASGR
jgi:hypothetical protein